jgi:hypothetical protein
MLIIAGISGFASDILYHPSQITGTMKSAGDGPRADVVSRRHICRPRVTI